MKILRGNLLNLTRNFSSYRRISMKSLNTRIENSPDFTEQCVRNRLLESFENHNISVEEYCLKIANDETRNYKHLLNEFAGLIKLPKIPRNFKFASGWTKYEHCKSEPVCFPTDKVMLFDVETLVLHQQRPVLAIAVSSTAWYSWCSHALFANKFNSSAPLNLNDLIAIEGTETYRNDRIIIGHNVSFDRSFIKEQYNIEKSQLRFLDTMSMHIACSGYSPEQQKIVIRNNPTSEAIENSYDHFKRAKKPDFMWMHNGCLNNLKDVHQFYSPNSKPIDKDTRNVFIKGDINDIIENFQSLIIYCANDVKATFETFREIYKIYSERFPSPITFEGLLDISTTYLPINQNWAIFKQNSEESQYKNKKRSKLTDTTHSAKFKLTKWTKKEISRQKEIWLPSLNHSGVILPMASYYSTVNRTCFDKLWSIKQENGSVGKELRRMIQPQGVFRLVKFDLEPLEKIVSNHFKGSDISLDIISTPILNSTITRCLEPKMCGDKFKDERLNCLIQSTCVDARDIMISNMNFLIKKYSIKARISYCFDNELVYLVNEADKTRVESIMNISYSYMVGFLAHKLGESFDETVKHL